MPYDQAPEKNLQDEHAALMAQIDAEPTLVAVAIAMKEYAIQPYAVFDGEPEVTYTAVGANA